MGSLFYIILDKDVERGFDRKGTLEYIDLIHRVYAKILKFIQK